MMWQQRCSGNEAVVGMVHMDVYQSSRQGRMTWMSWDSDTANSVGDKIHS